MLKCARKVFAVAKQVFAPSYSMTIIEQDEMRMVVESGGKQIVVNKRYRSVKTGAKVLALFDKIRFIDITYHEAIDYGEVDTWTVTLNLNWRSSVKIGRTEDEADASIVAARLGTMTGKKVRALSKWGH
jgi:hypothetical protein